MKNEEDIQPHQTSSIRPGKREYVKKEFALKARSSSSHAPFTPCSVAVAGQHGNGCLSGCGDKVATRLMNNRSHHLSPINYVLQVFFSKHLCSNNKAGLFLW
jgi:hypothetical protein